MKKVKSFVIILALCTLTACGRKEVDYSVDDSQDSSSGYSDISMETISEKIGVEEQWEEVIDEGKLKKVYADVVVPEVTGMKVVDVEPVDYPADPEAKEQFIRSITDGTIYYNYWKKEDYDWHIATVQEELDYLEAEGGDDTYYDSRYEYLGYLEAERENAPESYIPAEDFKNNGYYLEYNEMLYTIEFIEYSNTDYKSIEFGLWDNADLVDMENINLYLYDVPMVEGDENRCTMTAEEAKSEAQEFINSLNVGVFSCVDTMALKYSIYTNSNRYEVVMTDTTEQIEYLDGYTFRFVRSIDGINVDGNYYLNGNIYSSQVIETLDDTTINYGWAPESSMEEIFIRVNDKGIVAMTYHSPMEITGVNAENVKLLAFDEVKSSIAYVIDEKTYYEYTSFKYLELTYFLYHDKEEDKHCIIPVWRLTDKTMDLILRNNEKFSYVVINAMDGSVINVGEQICRVFE